MVGRPRRAPDRARLPRAAPASLLLMPPAARHREVRRRPPRRAPARGAFAVARRHRRLGRRQEVPGCLACRSEYPARAVAETGVAGSRRPPTPSLPCGSAARCCSPGSPAADWTFWCLDALQRCRIGDRCAVGILVGKPAPAAHSAYPGAPDGATAKSHVWRATPAGYSRWTMVKRTSSGTSPEFSSLALSLHHHRRQDDERPGVYRHPHQDQCCKHQSDGDEYSAQRSGVGRVVDPTPWRNLLHDVGLPRRHHCHTWPLTAHRSAGG